MIASEGDAHSPSGTMENYDLNVPKIIPIESNLIQTLGLIGWSYSRNPCQHRLERRPIRLLSRYQAFGKRIK